MIKNLLIISVFSCITHFLFTIHSLNAQAGWSPDQRLVFMQGGGWYPRAACCGDTIHLVWYQSYPIYDEVFYKRSTDAGLTWGADIMLSVEDTWLSIFPQVAVSNSIVHVIWGDYGFGLFYRRSTDGGTTWNNIDSLAPGIGYSSIRAFGDTVYVCGIAGSQSSLRFTKSVDSGNNWTPIINLTTAEQDPNLRIISNNSSNIVISFQGIYEEVFYVCSCDAGETWSDSQMISDDGIPSQCPAMDTDNDGGIYITWFDYKYSPYPWTGDILYRASADSGNTWFDIDSLTTSHRAVLSDILAESTNLHLVWEDDRYDFDDNFEIFYRMSTDLGQSWTSEVRLTNALGWSHIPSLACDNRYLHLFWKDCRDDSNNAVGVIYYKRKDLLMPTTENRHSIIAEPIISVYPNPFREEIKIGCMIQDTRFRTKDISIKLFDVGGKEVVIKKKNETGSGGIGETATLNTKGLSCGVYFLVIRANNMQEVHKVVKVK